MADTYTTKLNLTKPEIGASTDTWGNKLNDNSDTVDALFDTGPYLKVTAGGTGAGTAANARTNLGLGTLATQAADAVAITGGTATFASAVFSGSAPYSGWQETDGAADSKNWRFYADSQQLTLRLYNDALTTYGTALTFTRTGTTPASLNVGSTLTVSNNVVYHAGNISSATILESQIQDAAFLARVASNETISGAWTISGSLTRSSQGRYVYLNGSGNTGGGITISTADPTGTPANGDIWVKYVA